MKLLADQLILRSKVRGENRHLGELWYGLSDDAKRHAATCPYLMLDAGFADAARWRVEGIEPNWSGIQRFVSVPETELLVRQLFVYAWHLSQSVKSAAHVLLGTPKQSLNVFASCTLSEIQEIAERYPSWLRPRRPVKMGFWQQLLLAAESGEYRELEIARMHGLQLLAAGYQASFARNVPTRLRGRTNGVI